MPVRIYKPTEAEIDAAAALLLARSPGESKRYIAATKIVAVGAISHDDANGWTVASQAKPGKASGKTPAFYRVTPTSCECYDHKHSGGMACKHISAMQLYMRCVANALDTALRHPAELEASATATGWRGMLDGLDPDDALAAAEYAAAQPADTRLEVLPGAGENRRNIYDAATHAGICVAQQQPGGQWRPCTVVDTVAWVRWLGAQQVEAEVEVQPVEVQPAHYAGGMLVRILTECPADVDGVTLKARVIYGSTRTYTLTGYLYAGATWVNLDPQDHQKFNEAAWVATLEATGWIQPERPVKADGLSYRYTLVRGTAAQEHYGLKAGTEDWRREQRLQNMFTAQVAANAADAVMVDALDRQFSS